MLKQLIYILLFASGCYGAYGFTFYGVDNPLVWALEGAEAPFLWLCLIGVAIDACWRNLGRKPGLDSYINQ
jgi:TRAP-type C4-dicarboxylate transport system permease small subunit